MPGRTNDEQIGANFVHEVHNHANGMTADDVDLHLDPALFSLKAGPFDDRMEAARGNSLGFPYFLYVLRHRRNLFHANQMKRRRVLPGHSDCQIQRLERGLRSIIGMQDDLEHRKSPAIRLAPMQLEHRGAPKFPWIPPSNASWAIDAAADTALGDYGRNNGARDHRRNQ